VATGNTVSCNVASWKPDPALLVDHSFSAEFATYRKRHAGYEVTSYSRMKAILNAEGDLIPLGRAEFDQEVSRAVPAGVAPREELPGGITAGLLLHELLEEIPFESLKTTPAFEQWRNLPLVEKVITASLDRHNLDPACQSGVEAMVHGALTCTIPISHGNTIAGLYQCPVSLREMEFLFPYPERDQPGVSEARAGKLVVERGFVKGYIDLVFEHDGLVYFVDWKTDILPSYAKAVIYKHVTDHYDLQIKLYVLALLKALVISSESEYEKRFGGFAYIFLRGLQRIGEDHPGIYSARPPWSVVLGYETEVKGLLYRSRSARP